MARSGKSCCRSSSPRCAISWSSWNCGWPWRRYFYHFDSRILWLASTNQKLNNSGVAHGSIELIIMDTSDTSLKKMHYIQTKVDPVLSRLVVDILTKQP